MLGQDVARLSGGLALARAELDVTDRAAVSDAIGPDDLVFNCAAWTDVDRAEAHEEDATRVNAEGARNVAVAAGTVVYVSTDYVFDGQKRAPYLENDPVGPLSAYGRSKLEGELVTAEANPRHFVVRSSWLFGTGWWTTRWAAPRSPATSPRRWCASPAPMTTASTIWRRRAPAPGSSSPRRSSRGRARTPE
jgi:dTDP-4-dehydrorhamnose reductase